MAIENNKTINDLPLEVLRGILLKFPVKSLSLLKCVSKTWLHLISDPDFAKSHFELAAAPTRRCLFIQGGKALSYDLEGYAAVKFSLPCRKSPTVYVMESCRGFILLDQYPNLIIWNPSTGGHRRISYYHIVLLSRVNRFQLFRSALFYGLGYDASKDEYLVVLGWRDKNEEDHFDFFSTRTNSWNNFEVALPIPLGAKGDMRKCGLFLNGALHWFAGPPYRAYLIFAFDLKKRSFSEIPLPERKRLRNATPRRIMELEGCLALHFWTNEIWVMKEYKMQSSWTYYGGFGWDFYPLGSSNDGDITGYDSNAKGFSKYGHRLEHCGCQWSPYRRYSMYTDSLMSLPNDPEAKKNGLRVSQEGFEQLDALANHHHNEVRERKRIRTAPNWARDFYCN